MIKKIAISRLLPGMYLHDLNVGWMDHPFMRNQFKISSADEIAQIAGLGVREIYIDTDRGLDVHDAPTADEVKAAIEVEMARTADAPHPARMARSEEMARAKVIHREANKVVRAMLNDVRLGQAVRLEQAEEVVEAITGSILRNDSALIGLGGIKNKDEYTFQHSVSVCTLLVAFAQSHGMDASSIRLAGIGGLLHDAGKMKVPDAILNKPGKYTDEEFAIMKAHPEEGEKILLSIPGIHAVSIDIAAHHHERYDGSGYPRQRAGEELSEFARMAAIVDVYDAITSTRCYHRGMPAAEGLRKLWEWSKFHFDPKLVQDFIRTVGIYPVGSLVKLESGRLAIVLEQNETSLLSPCVKAVFSTRSNTYIQPLLIDLARPMGHGGGDRILGYEDPAKWKIDTIQYLQA